MLRMSKLNGLHIIDITKGQPNGIASLDANGEIPATEVPSVRSSDDLMLYAGSETSLTSWRNSIGEAFVWKDANSWKDVLGDDVISVGCSESCIVYATSHQLPTSRYEVTLYVKRGNTSTQVWQKQYNDNPSSIRIVHLHDTIWQMRSSVDNAYISWNDGETWNNLGASHPCLDALHANGVYVCVVPRQYQSAQIKYSTDGSTFTTVTLSDEFYVDSFGALLYAEGVWFFAINNVARVYRSLDNGASWEVLLVDSYARTAGPLMYMNRRIYLCTTYSNIKVYRLSSVLATSFTLEATNSKEGAVIYANGYWYICNNSGVLRRTKNFSSWENCSVPITLSNRYLIDFVHNKYFLLTESALYSSNDGVTFTLLRSMTSTIPGISAYMWQGNAANKRIASFVYYRKGVWIFVRYGSNGISWTNDLVTWHDEEIQIYPTYPESLLISSLGLVSTNLTFYRNNDVPLIPYL